ncbi:hypothetical protein SAMN04489716_2233 [Actinoplanes derwentensis]|uniref:Uncharacterized protein n=2 Tax=Actinoplanes derwentensis TaxID=113562 RepID=A0A1H1WTW4_9ACTN|nr:hypothetical protein SAMN04489716_2233 [Actinoplanes derwentensis]
MDVYIWLPKCDAGELSRFIESYVDRERPGDDRLATFIRAYIEGAASDDDRAALAELGRGDTPDDGFSLYLEARVHYAAIITITREGSAVLGLSIDDPDDSPETPALARALIGRLRADFRSPAGRAGFELAPAHSREEWENDGLVQIREGELPRETL